MALWAWSGCEIIISDAGRFTLVVILDITIALDGILNTLIFADSVCHYYRKLRMEMTALRDARLAPLAKYRTP